MDIMLWFVLIVLLVAIGFFIFGDDLLRILHKNDRIKKSTGNALNNVRIDNRAVGTVNKPVEIEPMGTDKFKLIMRAIHPPFNETVLILKRWQLKHDPIETLHTGRISYWIAADEFLQIPESDTGTSIQHPGASVPPIDNIHPTYTKEELLDIHSGNEQKLQIAESKINELETNAKKDMTDNIGYVGDLLRNAKPQTPKK